jgi:seryl-tRNA synthetase
MHDLRAIRDNPGAFDEALKKRGLPPRADEVLALDKEWRATETKAQEAQALGNRLAREIGIAKRAGGDAADLMRQSTGNKAAEAGFAREAAEIRKQIDELLAALPNLPGDDVPVGPDETANVLVRTVGQPPQFNFAPLPHDAIGEKLGMMDFARAAKLSGSRFVVLKGALARLERALAQFMLDMHTGENGYSEVAPPFLVREETAYGTGNLPKAAEDMFQTTAASGGMWLIPTAEMPLTNLVAGETLNEKDLPLRFTAWTPCFRSEAGAAGRDTRGMIRVHQFPKVELVSITKPEDSAAEHERMTACAEEVLKRLGLAYRVMLLSSGDMGFAAHKTYDLEVWLPGQNAYREISSCSNCGAFQARRMNARYRPASEKARPAHVHTLNGSGLAVGRTLIAILENYQRHDGTVVIPPALQPYMSRMQVIEPHG